MLHNPWNKKAYNDKRYSYLYHTDFDTSHSKQSSCQHTNAFAYLVY